MNAGLKNYSFVVFTVINFIGVLLVWFYMPETTGKDLDTLVDESIDSSSCDNGQCVCSS